MDILNSMLQMAVWSAYNREGIEEAFKVIKDEADARKDNKKKLKTLMKVSSNAVMLVQL